MRRNCFWLLGLITMMLASSSGYTQFPGGGDPSQFFYKLSNGKEVIHRSEVSPFFLGMFDKIADKLGITGDEITKAQFEQYSATREKERAAERGDRSGDKTNRDADYVFQRADKNGDGVLSFDEMSDALKLEREKWDTNGDGVIDREEYRAYFAARMQNRSESKTTILPATPTPPAATPKVEDEAKPIVYRAGKLPSELPAWFAQLDTDGDGQIGLYEWKVSGRSMEEFNLIDRNGDGFLTIAEVLRSTGATALASAGTAAAAKTKAEAPRSGKGDTARPSADAAKTPAPGTGGWGSMFKGKRQ